MMDRKVLNRLMLFILPFFIAACASSPGVRSSTAAKTPVSFKPKNPIPASAPEVLMVSAQKAYQLKDYSKGRFFPYSFNTLELFGLLADDTRFDFGNGHTHKFTFSNHTAFANTA